jgi:hypothetical protein
MNRKRALKRLDGLAPRVEEHLGKIADDRESRDLHHWISEVNSWIEQMEDLLPAVGNKSAAKWRTRIAGWKVQLGE